MNEGHATKCLLMVHGEVDPYTLFMISDDQLQLSTATLGDTSKELQLLLKEFEHIFQ